MKTYIHQTRYFLHMAGTEKIPWIDQAINLFLGVASQYRWTKSSGIWAGGYIANVERDGSYGSFRPLRDCPPVGLGSQITIEFCMNVNRTLGVDGVSEWVIEKYGRGSERGYCGTENDRYAYFFSKIVKMRDIPKIVPEVERKFKKSVEDFKELVEREKGKQKS